MDTDTGTHSYDAVVSGPEKKLGAWKHTKVEMEQRVREKFS
jgi:hypothetical protein